MPNILEQFASEPAADGGLFGALGINLQMIIFQIIGFCILVWIMGKFVYPVLMRSIDARQAAIEEGNKAAVAASEKAAKAQEEIEAMLKESRQTANEIVTTAKEEAAAMVNNAEEKAKKQAEHIVAAAHEDIEKEVVAAKKALHNETLDLVAAATEKVVGNAMTEKLDKKVIETALREQK